MTFLQPLLSRPASADLALVIERTGGVLASRIEAAVDSAARRRGLLGRSEMAAGEALVIAPCAAVHTCFMRFPIDIVFARRDGRIAGVRTGVRAWRLAFAWRAFATIELPVGTTTRTGVRRGDRLTLRSVPF